MGSGGSGNGGSESGGSAGIDTGSTGGANRGGGSTATGGAAAQTDAGTGSTPEAGAAGSGNDVDGGADSGAGGTTGGSVEAGADANASDGGPPIPVCGALDLDTDGDGVCDLADRCPGYDDRLDQDSDGRPDGCEPELLIDLDVVDQDSIPDSFVDLGGYTYFGATDWSHGGQLWRTDGTTAGTTLVSSAPSKPTPPQYLTRVGSQLYYDQTDDLSSTSIWTSDGTPAGTHLLVAAEAALVNAGPSGVYYATSAGGLYRAGATLGSGVLLNPERYWGRYWGPAKLDALGYLFIEHAETNGTSLWRTDGTPQGTGRLLDATPIPGPHGLTEFGGKVYFFSSENVQHLWVTDGTDSGTKSIPTSTPANLAVEGMVSLGTRLLFSSGDELGGALSLWVSDGTTAGTTLVQTFPSQILTPVAASGIGYFQMARGGKYELWQSDGTAGGTSFIAAYTSTIERLTPVGTGVYFAADDALRHYSPGTSVTTVSPAFVTHVSSIGISGSNVYFSGSTPKHGYELWLSDGSPGNAVQVENINTATEDGSPEVLGGPFTGGRVVLAGSSSLDPSATRNLWMTDGTPQSTSKVFTGTPGKGTFPWLSTGDTFCFTAPNASGSLLAYALDVPSATYHTLAGAPALGSAGTALVLGDRVVYASNRSADGTAPWAMNVTDLLAQPYPAFDASTLLGTIDLSSNVLPPQFTEYGGYAYFFSDGGTRVYRTDGTALGTTLVGTASSPIGGFLPFAGNVYFLSYMPTNGLQINRIDVAVPSISTIAAGLPATPATPFGPDWAILNGWLYFAGTTPATGAELYRTDGTRTELFADINPGTGTSFPSFLVIDGARLFFAADDGVHGIELWSTDGVASHTRLVSDSRAGSAGSGPRDLFVHRRIVYYSADDGVHGKELWRSDGTSAGTYLEMDINPGPDDSTPRLMLETDAAVYLTARTDQYGAEPWVMRH